MENALRPTVKDSERTDIQKVLILIFLENALRRSEAKYVEFEIVVLILIFLENALRLADANGVRIHTAGLNPYFFGKCSTALQAILTMADANGVLILIFLENALRQCAGRVG